MAVLSDVIIQRIKDGFNVERYTDPGAAAAIFSFIMFLSSKYAEKVNA